MTLPCWSNVDLPGCYTLLRLQKQLPAAANSVIIAISKKIKSLADTMIANGGNQAFTSNFGQGKKDFVSGSNAVVMNESILLLNAYLIYNNKKYLLPALSNLSYVLGQNATGYCFVTGFGSKPSMHPHHRPSIGDNVVAPIPGLLVGDLIPVCRINVLTPIQKLKQPISMMIAPTQVMKLPLTGMPHWFMLPMLWKLYNWY